MNEAIEQARWLRETVGVRVLELGALRVTGDDAREWLNGQITNDVGKSSPGSAIFALAVSVRGKVQSELWVLDRGDETFDLLVPREKLSSLEAHFDRYIVMEDVELESRPVNVVSAQGPGAEAMMEAGAFACDRLGLGGVDFIDGDADALVAKASALGGGAVEEPGWELARIRAGRPAFGVDFDDRNYPQEAGLRDLAVSFSKGCYMGQEVVCMLENRGQLRRRLVQLRGDALPPPGSELRVDGKPVGQVRSGTVDPEDGKSWIFGYLKRAYASSGQRVESDVGIVTVREVVGGDGSEDAL